MEIIKKQVKGYIALESVMATGLLFSIVILVLTSLQQGQVALTHYRNQQEKLNLALMAVQTGREEVTLNGCHITVRRTEHQISIQDDKGEVIRIEQKDK
ncbi:UNVERIFIED_CONTAM: competence protein ComG [Streptococcus canis]|uniref:Competence protein ComG n=2 Tax=Streptococcus canis TaxID=1329 RepID=A0AAE4Q748_STRCB|nr:competence protein ComG [Streptococcus canis]MDV5987467.1 competence protein ComG [Streptococcus canis]MDV5993477.1 competence protein ComG [Streptococcus canis]MDV6000296.1 competence protein ComG [Streptococcus canis]MDV6021533.1 competence protein ComG [Streptococcus canis]